MQSPHPNAQTIQDFYASFEGSDWESRVSSFLEPDVMWHVAGNNPLAGDFRGVERVIEAMRSFDAHSEQTLRLNTTSVLADDQHAVAIHRATAKSRSFEYQAHEIDVFHFREGRITEFWSFSEDQPATDRMWSHATT